MAAVGARIKSLREHLGLEVGQLAYKTGISRAHIYRIENNERPNVSGALLALVAEALDTSTDYLLGLTNDPRSRPLAEDLDDDPELVLRRHRLAERIARLSPARQKQIIDAINLLTEVEAIADAVEDVETAPEIEGVE